MSVAAPRAGPAWVTVAVLPLVNLLAAFLVSGLVILAIGENPIRALFVLLNGAFGYAEGIGFTLYYTTNFIFAALSFALAFHCGLFNIGAEGQATIGGLGVGLTLLYLDFLPFWLILPVAIIAALVFGAAWAHIPGYLQARRGSHVVITTIMFNFIAATLMVYLLSKVLIEPGNMSPETRVFLRHTWLPYMHEIFADLGMPIARSPWNVSFLIALAASAFMWVFVWHTRWGYAIRTVGQNPRAAVYAGISPARNIMMAMALSGALGGLMGVNEIMGVNHRLLLNFTAGYGFVGIAVSLMGRNHPVGIVLASILFGALFQGGGELSFEIQTISREMVIVIQGLVILFAGALEYMFEPFVLALFRRPALPIAAQAG